MKFKFWYTAIVAITLLLNGTAVFGLAKPDPAATAAVLMDFTTGQILYEKNADERRAPASTTKIMTALLALERGELGQKVIASSHASKVGGSSIWLSPGESHRLEEMLYGVLLSSGNDASVAVAEALAGSEPKFASWMTAKAHTLGAQNTNFENSSGLPAPRHYSTARDLAVITRYALHNPTFDRIVRTKRKTMGWPGHKYDRLMVNHNKLLWRYDFADGVKTGYTREAGKCLVASATRNGHRLIAVVLNSQEMYEDSRKLFDYGFNNYQLLTLASPGKTLSVLPVIDGVAEKVPVLPNRPVTLVVPKAAADQVNLNVELPVSLEAPVEKMQRVGQLEVKIGPKLIEKVPLVAAAPVPKEGFWKRLLGWFKGLLS